MTALLDGDIWGIVATDTLHLMVPGQFGKPACGDDCVVDAMERIRASWVWDGSAPNREIYGPGAGRPVCRRCLTAFERVVEMCTAVVEVARERDGAAR
jgi:hypothetical protein